MFQSEVICLHSGSHPPTSQQLRSLLSIWSVCVQWAQCAAALLRWKTGSWLKIPQSSLSLFVEEDER